jgi:hypothetical protein
MSSIFSRLLFRHYLFVWKINEKDDSLIKKIKDVSNKKNDRQKQSNQILLFSERFEQFSFLQAVELIIVLESNWLSFMQEMHDQFVSSHLKINKTIKLLKRNHRSSKIIRDVKQYVRNCHICRRIKTARNKYHEMLNSLSIFDRSWTNIILDFLIKLFDNKEYNAIFMIINRLSKMHYYILCIIDENDITIEETTKLLV